MRSFFLFLALFGLIFAAQTNSLCDICLNIVDTIDKALRHGDDIEKAVHDFCTNDVPSFLVAACEKIIAQSLDTIIEALKDHKSAKEICQNIQLC